MKKIFNVVGVDNNKYEATLYLDGEIDGYFLGGVSLEGIRSEYNELLKEKDVRSVCIEINSGGGSVIEGNAIANFVKSIEQPTKAKIHFAASMATIIALACDEVEIASNGQFMIHAPSTQSMGNADDLREDAELLDSFQKNFVDVYSAKTGLDKEEISEMLKKDTYMDAEKAVSLGFCDRIFGDTTSSEAVSNNREINPTMIMDKYKKIRAAMTPDSKVEDEINDKVEDSTKGELEAEIKDQVEDDAKGMDEETNTEVQELVEMIPMVVEKIEELEASVTEEEEKIVGATTIEEVHEIMEDEKKLVEMCNEVEEKVFTIKSGLNDMDYTEEDEKLIEMEDTIKIIKEKVMPKVESTEEEDDKTTMKYSKTLQGSVKSLQSKVNSYRSESQKLKSEIKSVKDERDLLVNVFKVIDKVSSKVAADKAAKIIASYGGSPIQDSTEPTAGVKNLSPQEIARENLVANRKKLGVAKAQSIYRAEMKKLGLM